MAKKKILIVDDEPGFVDAVKMRLEANNYEVISAPDGQEGFRIARIQRPDLILLDLVMPNMNGFATLSRLKSDPRSLDIPVVIITAKNDKEYILDAGRLGVSDYLVKPVDMTALLEIVKKYTG